MLCYFCSVSLHLEKIKTRNTNTNANWGLNKHFWHFLLQDRVFWSKIMIHIVWINLVLKNIRTKIVLLEQMFMSSFSLFSLNRILAKTLLYGGENIFVFTEHMICTSRQFQEVNLNFLVFNIFNRVQSPLLLTHHYFRDIQIKFEYLLLSLEISSSQLLLHSRNEVIMCLCIIQEPAGWFLSFLQ